MSGRRRAVAALGIVLTASAVSASALAVPAQADRPTAAERTQHRDLQAAKAASARFHDVSAAVAAGFQPDPHCEQSAAGAMGHHYARPASFGSVDPREPAVLLYAPDGKGRLRLAGVEWVVPDDDQDLDTTHDRPSMFGGVPFDGPMEGHVPGMPRHYDLHVWLWDDNPRGTFAQWNPSFSC